MDNITHTLVGLVVGEAVARALPGDDRGLGREPKRDLVVALMVIGSNVPDFDLIGSRISGSKLDYLLDHRGHTHTIIGALVLALLLLALCELWCRWRGYALVRRDRIELGGVASLALLLHIALDALNTYGVHPFWPFDNRWFYGDAVFIVEPLFWAACAPLVFILRSAPAKGFVVLALLAGPAFGIVTRIVPSFLCATLVALTLVMLAIGRLSRPPVAVAAALATCVAISVVFLWSGTTAAHAAAARGRQIGPTLVTVDHALSPLPANPFCWQLILVQRDSTHWTLRRATLSLAPALITAQECPVRSEAKPTAPMITIRQPSDARIAWRDEIRLSRSELAQWIANDCRVAAFMRFARAPWIAEIGRHRVIGDLRFDHEPGLSFAEIDLGDPRERCAGPIRPWIAPRQDVLASGRE